MLICDTKYAYEAPNTVSPSGFSCILYLSFIFDSKIENEFSVRNGNDAMYHASSEIDLYKNLPGWNKHLKYCILATTQLGVKGKTGPMIGSRSTTAVWNNTALSLSFQRPFFSKDTIKTWG